MTVVTTLNLDQNLSDLKIAYQNIYTTNCEFSFQLEVLKSLKILSELLQIVRNKRNIFSKIPKDLLEYVFSFLPKEQIFRNLIICKNWFKMLGTHLENFSSKLPISLQFEHSFEIDNHIKRIKNNDNHIFISCYQKTRCYDNNLKLISTFSTNDSEFAVNNKYLCCYDNLYVKLYSLNEKKFIRDICSYSFVQGLTICKKYIYVVAENKVHIYNFYGKLLSRWEFKMDFFYFRIIISVYDDEIFLAGSYSNQINVFSFEGKLLRNIYFHSKIHLLKNLTISNNVIYVTTNENVLIYNSYGKFLFQVINTKNADKIGILENKIFVSSEYNNIIYIFNLIYDTNKFVNN